MTEDRAKGKWCPMYRIFSSQGLASNRLTEDSRCLASNCMMWRTIPEPEPEKMAREAQIPLKSATKFGYCGLAGKDEP